MKNSWHFPEYGVTVYFVTSLKEVRNEQIKAKFVKDMGECSGACHRDAKAGEIYILVVPEAQRNFIDLVDVVAHEVFHAVGFLYRDLGDATRLRDVGEVPAYIQGWLTGEIIKALGYE